MSPADRELIDAYLAEHGANVIPRGVSGLSIEQQTSGVWFRGNRTEKFRKKQTQRRKKYRRLVDEGKSGPEIAELLGVKVGAVYVALRRMGLKLQRSPL